jgi:protease-4
MGDQAKANGLVDELGGIDRALEMVRNKAGIPTTAKVHLVVFPGKRNLFEMLLRQSPSSGEASDAKISGILSAVGLEPVRAAWRDARLRVWMRGGMLQMMPFAVEFR